ncbi:phosphate-regulating neutral endopeptidase PHEX-like [Branchiostoma lanceolatum]|uniref:phosphate-regulating neutral endopeptidase PHEX-like n=1 Tax=Branchiostoma lanceolatum TaxID=7740 RepID=UPI003452AC37
MQLEYHTHVLQFLRTAIQHLTGGIGVNVNINLRIGTGTKDLALKRRLRKLSENTEHLAGSCSLIGKTSMKMTTSWGNSRTTTALEDTDTSYFAAFRAYRKWVEERGSEEQLLPGIGLTQNQMFFLNYANLRCSQYRPKGGGERASQGVHSPGEFRVIGSMSNFEEFAKAYNCPTGTPMNRGEKRCSVW